MVSLMILIMITISHVMIKKTKRIKDIFIIIPLNVRNLVATMMMNKIKDLITKMIFLKMAHQTGVVMNINEWVQKLIGINMILIKIGKMLMMLKVKENTLKLMKQLMMNGLKICIIKVINISEKVFHKNLISSKILKVKI